MKQSLNSPVAGRLWVRRNPNQIFCPKQRKRCFLWAPHPTHDSVQKSVLQVSRFIVLRQYPWCVFIFPLIGQLAQLASPQRDLYFFFFLFSPHYLRWNRIKLPCAKKSSITWVTDSRNKKKNASSISSFLIPVLERAMFFIRSLHKIN